MKYDIQTKRVSITLFFCIYIQVYVHFSFAYVKSMKLFFNNLKQAQNNIKTVFINNARPP